MRLAGLDFLIDQKGKPWLCEINGPNSGMTGFRTVYGDDRVQKQVCALLGMQPPNKARYATSVRRTICVQNAQVRSADLKQSVLAQLLGETAWPMHSATPLSLADFTYDTRPWFTYSQFTTADKLAGDKFASLELLRHSCVAEHIPYTTLVGLGMETNSSCAPLQKASKCVVKPIDGLQGAGVSVIASDQLPQRKRMRILTEVITQREPALGIDILLTFSEAKYGVRIAQPFIDTQDANGCFRSVRAIVCKGKFIDAYTRVSRNPIVNIALGAHAEPYTGQCLASLSEAIVHEFRTAVQSVGRSVPAREVVYRTWSDQQPQPTSREVLAAKLRHQALTQYDCAASTIRLINILESVQSSTRLK